MTALQSKRVSTWIQYRLFILLISSGIAVSLFGCLVLIEARETHQDPAVVAKASISGLVTSANQLQPLRGAKVTLRSKSTVRLQAFATATTDNNGYYMMSGIDPGQYYLTVDREGYLHQEFRQQGIAFDDGTLTLRDGGRVVVNIQMIPTGVISGTIIDRFGEPVSRVPVAAYRHQYSEGIPFLAKVGEGRSDDRGAYRIFSLSPGEYVVGIAAMATPDQPSSVDVSAVNNNTLDNSRGIVANTMTRSTNAASVKQHTIYYPRTPNPEAAVVIRVKSGNEATGIDLISEPLQTVSVRGRVITQAAGTPESRKSQVVQVLPLRVGVKIDELRPVHVGPDYTFAIEGVTLGDYEIVALSHTQNKGDFVASKVRVAVGPDGVRDLIVPIGPAAEILGRVRAETGNTRTIPTSRMRVTLMSMDLTIGSVSAPILADGTFRLPNVLGLTYRIRLNGLPAGSYIESESFDSKRIFDGRITPAGGRDIQLEIVIGNSPGIISGSVLDRAGKPFGKSTVVLVPDAPYRDRIDRYLSVMSDSKGAYRFPSVPPGDYHLFAWEEVPPGAYQNGNYLRRFESFGTPVRLSPETEIMRSVAVIPFEK